jgi:platelet-activating factor acetylhydrolase
MMFNLPEVHGPFPVGATTFVVPARQPLVIGTSQIRASATSGAHHASAAPDTDGEMQPTLKLEEIAFTAFYPANIEHKGRGWWPSNKLKKGLEWLIR